MSALEDYERGVKEGRGQGRFSSYKPWLIVKKVKSCAVRSRTYIRRFGRLFHLMSDAEVQTLLQLDWDDNVVEVREQYPLPPELIIYICLFLTIYISQGQPLDEVTKDDLLSLIDERQGRASMMVASQRPLMQWYEYLGSGLHADAIVDRLRNTSYRIALKGRSLREGTAIAKKLKEVEEE